MERFGLECMAYQIIAIQSAPTHSNRDDRARRADHWKKTGTIPILESAELVRIPCWGCSQGTLRLR